LITLCHVFTQRSVLFLQGSQFFFDRHACTLLASMTFGKSPADLGSYVSK
jgi:hypothetical protein